MVSSIHAKLKPQSLSIHFQSGSYILSPSSIQTLDSLIQTLNPNDDFEILLEGHTDNIGNLRFNDSLSAKRVKAVKDFLIAQGMGSEILSTQFFGERNPAQPNTTAENKHNNRRVVLHLTRYYFESINDLEEALSETDNHFQLDPTKQQQIKGNQGVRVEIPANAFLTQEGEVVQEAVNVKLTEAIDLSSFLSLNLSTQSDGEMLQSGGMINISAQTASGKEVFLDSNKNLEIKVPYQNFQKGMEVFISDKGEDWTSTGRPVAADALNIYSLRPKLNFSNLRYFKVPHFRRDYTNKPSKPELIGKPKPPKRPNETEYFKSLKWYEQPIARIIKKRQNEAYTNALNRYEDNRSTYKRRKEHYERHSLEYNQKMNAYHEAYQKWNRQQLTDSLDFKNVEAYINAVNENKKIYEAIRDKERLIDEEWKRRIDSAMESYSDDSAVSGTLVNSYVMHYNELTWINIDRFLKYKPSDLRPITLKDTDASGEKTYIVFKDIKSLLPLRKSEDGKLYKRDGIPKKEKAALLAYKVEDGKALVYYEKISGKKKDYTLSYEVYKLSEFRALLKDLNG